MSKYAKVEDVIERLDYCIHLADTGYFNYSEKMMQRLRDEFADLPTIDIVHCKDCRHNPKTTKDFQWGQCVCTCEDDWYSYEPKDDFFCAYGERIGNG